MTGQKCANFLLPCHLPILTTPPFLTTPPLSATGSLKISGIWIVLYKAPLRTYMYVWNRDKPKITITWNWRLTQFKNNRSLDYWLIKPFTKCPHQQNLIFLVKCEVIERVIRIVIMNGMWDLATLRCRSRDSTLSSCNFDHTPTCFIPLSITGSLKIRESRISTRHLLERTFGTGIRK